MFRHMIACKYSFLTDLLKIMLVTNTVLDQIVTRAGLVTCLKGHVFLD